MDYRPVGIFDSGMGGLTAVRVLREMLPGEDIAYLGDTARVPYGGRSVEELRRIAESDARFLRAREIKAMLVACGTVSSNWDRRNHRNIYTEDQKQGGTGNTG